MPAPQDASSAGRGHGHGHPAQTHAHYGAHGHGGGHAHDGGHGHDQAQVLDLDAEVLADHIATIAAWLPVRGVTREIVDLGAGTGAGTLALLAQFPDAHVTAVDSSAGHLARLGEALRTEGLSDRVRSVEADLDAPTWPDLGTPDLVWASASMHHLADPDQALRTLREMLAPDGLLAVVELGGLPRFLPDGAPEDAPGLEERCHDATQQQIVERMPHRGADWEPLLTAAGFTVEDHLIVDVDVAGSPGNAVGAYALAALQGLRNAAAGVLSATDLAALDRLLDLSGPHSILNRDDLAVRTTRSVWAARRTAGEVEGPS